MYYSFISFNEESFKDKALGVARPSEHVEWSRYSNKRQVNRVTDYVAWIFLHDHAMLGYAIIDKWSWYVCFILPYLIYHLNKPALASFYFASRTLRFKGKLESIPFLWSSCLSLLLPRDEWYDLHIGLREKHRRSETGYYMQKGTSCIWKDSRPFKVLLSLMVSINVSAVQYSTAEAQLSQYNQPTGLRSLPLNNHDVSLVLSAAQCLSWQQNAMLLVV
jgi:hypothetical protein